MDEGKIICVWGSPHSGKTTFSTKLATAIYDNYKATVIVLYTDLETPALPVVFPNDKENNTCSVGVPLSKAEIDTEDVISNLLTVKDKQNFGFIGYKTGDNKFSYPKYGRAKAEELLATLCKLADYVIVDCTSAPESGGLASTALELSWQTIRLASPDLSSISWYLSQKAVYSDAKYKWDEQIQGLNVPVADTNMPVEEAKAHLTEVAFVLPNSIAVRLQAQKGTLAEPSADKRFEGRMREIAGKAVSYDTD